MPSAPDRGLHAAIIMDGNGRWAEARGLPRGAGHRAGIEAIRRTAEAAPDLGIGTLTLYAFSSDNWQRPEAEVGGLMRLLRAYLRGETGRLARTGSRLTVIGRRDRLPAGLPEAIARAEAATAGGTRLALRIAVDYSARDAILAAAVAAAAEATPLTRERFARLLGGERPAAGDLAGTSAGTAAGTSAGNSAGNSAGDVDLLIRTGGEKRLSDFLLWEAAYAELLFTDRHWPDFGGADLAAAVADFRARTRRFGGLSTVPVAA